MTTGRVGTASNCTRVFIVDDHRVVRTGLVAYLDQVDDVMVVGEAGNGQQALDRIATMAPGNGLPHVVLMDIVMPVLGGIEATRQIKLRWPAVEVIAMTSYTEESTIRNALAAGAAGYLLKDADADQVTDAIRDAVAGRVHLDPTVARALADSIRRPPAATILTPREREVLALVADGKSNRQIAGILLVGERTARTHVSAILAKLGLVSRTQAALWAVRERLPPGSPPPS
jgi:DNA-binding NarL/FixJ family response regulator